MEVLSLLGLFGAGNALSNNDKKINNNIKHKNLPPKNFDNIYSSNNVPRTQHTLQNIANKRIKESTDYTKEKKQKHVGWADEDSEFSNGSNNSYGSNNSESSKLDKRDPEYFQKASSKMMNNERFEQKINNTYGDYGRTRDYGSINNGSNNYLSQFDQLTFDNPSEPSAINMSAHKVGPRAAESKLETERKLALDGNYLYKYSDNNAPDPPEFSGPSSGKPGISYEYLFNVVDPDGDQVKYVIDWGDGKTDTTDFNPSSVDVSVSHTWSEKGDYSIKAHAQDEYGLNSLDATFSVTIPRTRASMSSLFLSLAERFPILKQLLQLLDYR